MSAPSAGARNLAEHSQGRHLPANVQNRAPPVSIHPNGEPAQELQGPRSFRKVGSQVEVKQALIISLVSRATDFKSVAPLAYAIAST